MTSKDLKWTYSLRNYPEVCQLCEREFPTSYFNIFICWNDIELFLRSLSLNTTSSRQSNILCTFSFQIVTPIITVDKKPEKPLFYRRLLFVLQTLHYVDKFRLSISSIHFAVFVYQAIAIIISGFVGPQVSKSNLFFGFEMVAFSFK